MLAVYWAAKGGAGATVLATSHALLSAFDRPTLLVDFDGDLSTTLGVTDSQPGQGLAEWLRTGSDVPADALERLLVPIRENLCLLPRGEGPLPVERAGVLANLLLDMPRAVVVDAGTRPGGAAQHTIRSADRSILVTRACYLAIRRAQHLPIAPSEIALVREHGRALSAADVEAALGAPVRTVVSVEPGIARAVDAGLLVTRLPRALRRPLSRAA